MKKIVVFSLATAVALMSQAAQVNWTSGNLNAAKAAQTDIQSIKAYYFAITDNDALAIAQNALSQGQDQLYYTYFNEDGTVKDNSTLLNKTESENGQAVNVFGVANYTQDNPTLVDDYDSDGTADTAYVVAIYQANSAYGGTYALASIASATFDKESEFADPDVDIGGFTGIGTAAYTSGSGWAAVPEPTTVALLALGLAAVGIKRKVA